MQFINVGSYLTIRGNPRFLPPVPPTHPVPSSQWPVASDQSRPPTRPFNAKPQRRKVAKPAHPLQARRLHHKGGPGLLWQHASRVQGVGGLVTGRRPKLATGYWLLATGRVGRRMGGPSGTETETETGTGAIWGTTRELVTRSVGR